MNPQADHSGSEQPVHRPANATDARQGYRAGFVWRVLIISLGLAVSSMAVVWSLS